MVPKGFGDVTYFVIYGKAAYAVRTTKRKFFSALAVSLINFAVDEKTPAVDDNNNP